MSDRRVLIVGLGIAGMAAAVSLRRAGWSPVIVERAPARRSGGYFIGFFPPGKEAAKALGVYEDIHVRTPSGASDWNVRGNGDRKPALCFLDQPGAPDAVLRGDIEAGLWTNVEGQSEVRFSTIPAEIRDAGDHVVVTLENTATGERSTEKFDLVVGADGLRSTVRKMVFGPDETYMVSLDSMICAYTLRNQVPGYNQADSITVAESKRSVWVFPFSDCPPAVLLTYRTKDVDAEFKRPPIEVLRQRYAGMPAGGVVKHALEELATAEAPLFDATYQVRMDRWSKGRVVLVGDAAWSLTLYSGMGATMGIKGGAELGDAIAAHGDDVFAGLAAWEAALRPIIVKEQRATYIKRELFLPSNSVTRVMRAAILDLLHFLMKRKKAKAAKAGKDEVASDAPATQRAA